MEVLDIASVSTFVRAPAGPVSEVVPRVVPEWAPVVGPRVGPRRARVWAPRVGLRVGPRCGPPCFYERAFGAKEQAVPPRRLGELDEGALRQDVADVRVAVLILGDLDADLHPAFHPCVIQSWFRAGNRPSGPDFARTPPGKALQSAI